MEVRDFTLWICWAAPQGLSSLCCHTGESNSFHRHFAEGQLTPWGLTAVGNLWHIPWGYWGVIPTKSFCVSVGCVKSSSQEETFPSLSCETVQITDSHISRWVKFQRNHNGFDTSQMLMAEVLTPPLIPSPSRQGPWTWHVQCLFPSHSVSGWLCLPPLTRNSQLLSCGKD